MWMFNKDRGMKRQLKPTIRMKQAIANVLSLSILLELAPYHAFAQDKSGKYDNLIKESRKTRMDGAINAKDITNIASGIGDIYGQYLQITQGNTQAQMNRQEMEMLQKELTPQKFPNDFFPQCEMLQAETNKAIGYCETIATDQDYEKALVVKMQATLNMDVYKKYSESGLKTGDVRGLQCLDENLKKMKSDLRERAKIVDALQRDLNDAEAALNREIEPVKLKIEQIDRDLNGDKTKTVNIKSLLPANSTCASVVEESAFQDSKSGLKGFYESKASRNLNEATDLIGKGNNLVTQINKDIASVLQRVQSRAQREKFNIQAGNLISLEGSPLAGYASLQDPLKNFEEEITTNSNDLKEELIGLEIDKLGADTNRIMRGLDSKNEDIDMIGQEISRNSRNACLNNKVDTDAWKSRTFSRNARVNDQSNIKSYFQYIDETLSNNQLTSKEKADRIKAYEASSGFTDLAVDAGTVIRGQAKDRPWRVSELVTIYEEDCKSEFESIKQPNGKTGKQILDSLKKLKTKKENLLNSIQSKLGETIRARLINCEGIVYTPGPKSCDKDKLSPAGQNFCINQSLQCASQITSCHAEVKKIVETKEAERSKMAEAVNNRIVAKKAELEVKFKQFEQKMLAQAEKFKRYFPTTNFSLPTDLKAIFTADKRENVNGAEMLNPKIMFDALRANLGKVREHITGATESGTSADHDLSGGQNKELVDTVENSIKAAQTAYQKEYDAWSAIIQTCQANMDQYQTNRNNKIAEDNKAIAEKNKVVSRFCASAAAVTATPGCGTVSSFSDTLSAIRDQLELSANDAAAVGEIENYNYLCEGSQSHDESPESSNIEGSVTIDELCEKSQYKSNKTCKKYDEIVACTNKYYQDKNNYTDYKCKNSSESGHNPTECAKLSSFNIITVCGNSISDIQAIQEEAEALVIKYNNSLAQKKAAEGIGEKSFEVCSKTDESNGVMKDVYDSLRDIGNIDPSMVDER
jgi:hypothetical protein